MAAAQWATKSLRSTAFGLAYGVLYAECWALVGWFSLGFLPWADSHPESMLTVIGVGVGGQALLVGLLLAPSWLAVLAAHLSDWLTAVVLPSDRRHFIPNGAERLVAIVTPVWTALATYWIVQHAQAEVRLPGPALLWAVVATVVARRLCERLLRRSLPNHTARWSAASCTRRQAASRLAIAVVVTFLLGLALTPYGAHGVRLWFQWLWCKILGTP